MKTYHLVQLRFPGQLFFSSPLVIEIDDEDRPRKVPLEVAFDKNPSAVEGRYIKEITKASEEAEYLTRAAETDRPF